MILKIKKIFPPIFLFILIVIFLSPYLFSQNIPYVGDFTGSDLTELNLPFRYLSSLALKNGEIPHLTGLLANGLPILAEGQAGVFYPLNFLYIFLPFFLAVNLALLLNFFLAGFFSYIYFRILKISQMGSLLAAVSFCFSGFFIFRLKHLNMINSAIWLPLELYLVERYFSEKKSKAINLILLALVFALQFFAGHPQIFYISFLSVFLYFCLKIIFASKEKFFSKLKEIILFWVFVTIIFCSVSAIQLVPTFFYAKDSSRGFVMDYLHTKEFPYLVSSLQYFVSPYFLGNPSINTYPSDRIKEFGVFWENNFYFGLLPLLLAIYALLFLFFKKLQVRILFFLIFLSLLLSFGASNPLFLIFWELIPGFKIFRFPQRFMILGLVCLAALAGFGFDFFWDKIKKSAEKFNFLKNSKLLFNSLLPLVIIIIIAADLFLVAYSYLGVLDYKKYFIDEPKSVEFLKQDKDHYKIYSLGWPEAWNHINNISGGWQNNFSLFISGRELLPPNLNVFWGISSIQDRASLEGGMISNELFNLSYLLDQSFKKNGEVIFVSEQTLKILGMQNVKYLLSFRVVNSNNLILVKEIKNDFLPSLKIYKNNYFLPFAFDVFETRRVEEKKEIIKELFDLNFNPSNEIILDEDSLNYEKDGQKAILDFYERSNSRYAINVDFSHDGYLFLSQSFDKFWQAEIDGIKSNLLRANYAFIALKISAGRHNIVFTYKPLYFTIGKWITIVSLIFLVLFLFYHYLFKEKINEK